MIDNFLNLFSRRKVRSPGRSHGETTSTHYRESGPINFAGYDLERIYSLPECPQKEPKSNFPLGFYKKFLREINRLGIRVITYADIFDQSDDWDYKRHYPEEEAQWRDRSSKDETYLLIQHDVDNHPDFTKRIVAMEAAYGIRSNIFLFNHRYTENGPDSAYEVDHEFFREAQKNGFVIGYHQNAFALAGFDLDRAIEQYRSDVNALRNRYDIRFVVPHGGVGAVVDGRQTHNFDVPMPDEFEGNLRWVYNRYGVRFARRWSDGGLRKTRDPRRIKDFDIIQNFLYRLKPGTRNFCLVHPQRWGYNVDTQQNPLLAKEEWYLELCAANNRIGEV